MIKILHREIGAVLLTVEGKWRTRILCYAHLGSIDLRGAQLADADLSYAVLQSSDWRGANLTGANLSRATFKSGRYDQHTLWPRGFVPAKHRLIYDPNTAKRPKN